MSIIGNIYSWKGENTIYRDKGEALFIIISETKYEYQIKMLKNTTGYSYHDFSKTSPINRDKVLISHSKLAKVLYG